MNYEDNRQIKIEISQMLIKGFYVVKIYMNNSLKDQYKISRGFNSTSLKNKYKRLLKSCSDVGTSEIRHKMLDFNKFVYQLETALQ